MCVREKTYEVQSGRVESRARGPVSGAERQPQTEFARVEPPVRFTPVSENRNSKKHRAQVTGSSRKSKGPYGRGCRCTGIAGPQCVARPSPLDAPWYPLPTPVLFPGLQFAGAVPQPLFMAARKPQRDLVFEGTWAGATTNPGVGRQDPSRGEDWGL